MFCIPGKVHGLILTKKVKCIIEELIDLEKCGFQLWKWSVDQAFVIDLLCEKFENKEKNMYAAHTVLEKLIIKMTALKQRVVVMYCKEKSVGERGRNFLCWKWSWEKGAPGSNTVKYLCGLSITRNLRKDSQCKYNTVGQENVMNRLWNGCFSNYNTNWHSTEKLQELVTEFESVCKRRKLRVHMSKSNKKAKKTDQQKLTWIGGEQKQPICKGKEE